MTLGACRDGGPVKKNAAFYHWQTNFAVDSLEHTYLDHLEVTQLYVKFFDIDWDAARQELVPQATLEILDTNSLSVEKIIPCIFITNRSFQYSSPAQQEELVRRMVQRIEYIQNQFPKRIEFPVIQIDCDWTASTQQAYFRFLRQLKNNLDGLNSSLSVTIRLHQLADPSGTGVPPADEGVLMFYNMGDLTTWEEPNSILNLTAAIPYLKAKSYPFPLDLALPIYSWGVLFRDGQMVQLINDLQSTTLLESNDFRMLSPTRFIVTKSTYLMGHYVYKDDLIRVESPSLEDLQRALPLLDPIFKKRTNTIILYHLDAALLKTIPYAQLEALFY